jgi:hypothetical protein
MPNGPGNDVGCKRMPLALGKVTQPPIVSILVPSGLIAHKRAVAQSRTRDASFIYALHIPTS